MTVYRDKRDPVKGLSYTEGYDLGMQDCFAGTPRLVRAPRNANASTGRFGYSDGYNDAKEAMTARSKRMLVVTNANDTPELR